MAARLTELIASSALTASTTDAAGNCAQANGRLASLLAASARCDVDNVKPTAATDILNHTTRWQSVLDQSCQHQWIQADWSSVGPFAVASYSVLYGPLGFTFDGNKITHNVSLVYSTGQIFDASSLIACTLTSANNSGLTVRYDICSFSTYAPIETFNNVIGANFTWELARPAGGGACQMNVFEMNMHGIPMSQLPPSLGNSGIGNNPEYMPPSTSTTSPGIIAGFVVMSLVIFALLSVILLRQRNLARRKRAGRLLDYDSTLLAN
ncbi:hypothetical protein BC830DRAFT_1156498 [Chytriomyces sp. MP71]|nr:hypothetical protein BC830DRAFT_1157386 [Chytriomyces sp. MP71]KAI8608160.1 hypothetical protein BC830DRAFT_1156498 [Chytriomyces sp. MP71]